MNKAKKVIKCTHCHLMKGISWISFIYMMVDISREKDQMSSSWEFKSRSVLWKQKKRISVKENYGKLGESETLFSLFHLVPSHACSSFCSRFLFYNHWNEKQKKRWEQKSWASVIYSRLCVCFYVHCNLFRMIIILFVNSHKALSFTKYCQQLLFGEFAVSNWVFLNNSIKSISTN